MDTVTYGGEEPLATERAELRAALLRLDRRGADTVADRIAGLPFDRQLDHVYLPMLRTVGDRWQRGQTTVAEEHFASTFVRDRLARMLRSLPPSQGPRALCAGFPGETHEIGLLAVAVKLAVRGWAVDYFGNDLPLNDTVAVARTRGSTLVCQSVLHGGATSRVPDHARALRARLDPSVVVAIGGPSVERVDPIPGVALCDSFDALEAVLLA